MVVDSVQPISTKVQSRHELDITDHLKYAEDDADPSH